ncbi:hypothetical protein F0562_000057 [Nyssa sinensis]|uniref:Myb-like protein X n=1 Tax=Nyssa sinensis TaxID=561372 RepID=A0A5J5BYV1_9ASTE|nr:hypothetical protein F0562_000057 [Nyssa sinensis]
MSRCFPFPPPGYEKKARADDADLIKKEKQREKRHKKEKRDKEKKEGKEKREKDRSDGKNRDKKDRKEKQREKKKEKEKEKEKDKDKDREKASSSGEKRVSGQSESYIGEKLTQKEKNRDKDKISNSDEKKQAIQFRGYDGEKPIRDSLPAAESDHSRLVQELDRRIRDEKKGAGRQLVEKFTGADKKKDEGMDRLVVNDTGTLAKGREKSKDKRIDNNNMDAQGIKDEAGFSGNRMGQNIAGMVQNGFQEIPRPAEKNIEKRVEGKEKSKDKEGDNKQGEKRKDKDREKKSQTKDKDREKEKKKVEKVKERNDHKNTEQGKLKDSNKNDLIGTHNVKNLHLPKECDNSVATEGNLKKRKVLGTNGFLHDDVRPNKMPRPTSHPLPENGRKLEPCQTPILTTSDKQGAANNLKVDNKERKRNGIIEVQPSLSISSTKPSPAITQADQIAEASMKQLHPDSKYLSQVLSVPKMDEWSDFDDQEWLFSCNDPPSKKLEVSSVGINEAPLVWAEALQIDSADVCALPYVIPY